MTREDAVYDICEGIKKEKIVPILGDNVFCVRHNKTFIPLQQYIVHSLLGDDAMQHKLFFAQRSLISLHDKLTQEAFVKQIGYLAKKKQNIKGCLWVCLWMFLFYMLFSMFLFTLSYLF